MNRAIGQPYPSYSLTFAPTATAVDPSQPGDFANPGARGERLNLRNFAQNLERHLRFVAKQSDTVNRSLSARPIGGNALIRRPHARRQLARLPVPVDRHAAARMEIAADAQPFGLERIDQLLADRHRAVFMECAVIA